MKYLVLFGLCSLMAGAAGCGQGEDSVAQDRPEIPSGPPPDEVVVKDVEEGSGPELEKGSGFTIDYVALYYKTGKQREANPNFNWRFGTGGVVKGWEIGLQGMREGGQRELIVPSRLAYGDGALVYLIKLLDVE